MKLLLSALFVCAAAIAEPGWFESHYNQGGGNQAMTPPYGPGPNYHQGGYHGGMQPGFGGPGPYAPVAGPVMMPPPGPYTYPAPGVYRATVNAGGGSFGPFGGSQWNMGQTRTTFVPPVGPPIVTYCPPYPPPMPMYGPCPPRPVHCGAAFGMPGGPLATPYGVPGY
ncbi:MAG: hypothetical protein HYR96_03350 [Deltaproteobacteria bacterium]|nr:hypothetical protein [Deltaproteobacteria bacterium]MBI3294282.1 hypothetical protein [Deltaproteobacteria bacterium]